MQEHIYYLLLHILIIKLSGHIFKIVKIWALAIQTCYLIMQLNDPDYKLQLIGNIDTQKT